MALLDGVKAQLQEQARQGRDDAALKAEVQAKLEAALAEDDALTTSLRDLDARIAETSAAIERLNAEREELQEGV